jgi:hypothetical protein
MFDIHRIAMPPTPPSPKAHLAPINGTLWVAGKAAWAVQPTLEMFIR